MTSTDRIAEIAARLKDLDQADDHDRNRLLALVWHHAPSDLAHLLSDLEAAQARLDKVRDGQIALARALAERSTGSAGRRSPVARTRYEGLAAGAGLALQVLLVELGEVQYDEAAEPTWDVVMGEGTEDA